MRGPRWPDRKPAGAYPPGGGWVRGTRVVFWIAVGVGVLGGTYCLVIGLLRW